MDPTDAIVALSSAPGNGWRSIVRMSGPHTVALAERLCGSSLRAKRYHAVSVVLNLSTPISAVLYIMRAPRSYTGENVVEIHLASPRFAEEVLERLVGYGCRPAQPGEFTQKAFFNGRVDLAQAEAVQGLIAAENEEERRAALGQLEGDFSGRLREMEHRLLDLCAEVEAAIDFVDQDIEIIGREAIACRTQEVQTQLRNLIGESSARRLFQERPRVLIFGPPNAGKSTLFNGLTGGHAMTSSVPGTTRDLIAGEAIIGGRILTLLDSAGAGGEARGVDREAIRMTRRMLAAVDLILFVVDAADVPNRARSLVPDLKGRRVVVVLNKMDRCRLPPDLGETVGPVVSISAKTGGNVDALRRTLEAAFSSEAFSSSARFHVSLRQHAHMTGAAGALERVLGGHREGVGIEFMALDLREAIEHIGSITGRLVSDEVLSRIFERFCIGK